MKKITLARTPKTFLALLLGVLFFHLPHGEVRASETAVIYKSAFCGCCEKWAEHLRRAGFKVEIVTTENLAPLKYQWRIPEKLWACHTARIGGYLVEGHVPVEDIKRLLAEKPDAVGIAVPGMPIGSPGMEIEGRPAQPYYSILFEKGGGARVYARH